MHESNPTGVSTQVLRTEARRICKRTSHDSPVRLLEPMTRSEKTECDRDERSFMRVAATARRVFALSSRPLT